MVGRRAILRYTIVFLLLSACASVPEYPSPYSAPGNMYGGGGFYPGAAPVAPAMSSAPCNSNYSATPPPLGLYPCPMPSLSAYSGFGYSPYGFTPFGYSPYGYSPFGYSPFGYSPYGAPLYAAAYARRAVPHFTHSGRRWKK
jgi:hypothetical protein